MQATIIATVQRVRWILVAAVLIISQIGPMTGLIANKSAHAASGGPSTPSCTPLYGAPCITADSSDYSPNDTIHITGYGFVANIGYIIAIESSNGSFTTTNTITADTLGSISFDQPLDGVYRPNYTATIKDIVGNIIATTNFTDSRNINSATVNSGATTTVAPAAIVLAGVTVTTTDTGGSTTNDWQSTKYQIGANAAVCENTNNHNSSGTNTETFNITAPAAIGTYNVTFWAYEDGACTTNASSPLTLTNAITVQAPAVPITITGVTVNGSATPTMTPAKVVPVVVNADVTAGNQWQSTQWRIDSGSWTCENTADKTGAGSFNVTFNITAPIILGAHTFEARAFSNSSCSQNQSNTYSLANTVNVSIVANPALSDSCGMDIALVIDSSGSISSTELTQMKAAYTSFLNAFLPATSTQFSVTDFDTNAAVVQSFTANLTQLTTAVNSPNSGGYTNWHDGLTKAQSTFDPRADKPNLVIFASDGNPNTIIGGSGGGASEAEAVNAAVGVADALKTSGTRVVTLGIGDGLNVDNLKAISGPNVGTSVSSDVITSNFSSLATDLANLAKTLCGGTITTQKIIDQDGLNLGNSSDQSPGIGWTFDINGSPTNPAATQTGSDGYTASVKVENGTYSVAETTNANYTIVGASCSGATNNGTLSGNAITGIVLGTDQIVNCKFYNKPNPAQLIVKKHVINDNGGTKVASNFTLNITGSSVSSSSVAGNEAGTTITLSPGSYSVDELAVLSGYTKSIGANCSGTIAIGETKTCTITNDDQASTLIVNKTVINDNGGTKVASDFSYQINGAAAVTFGASGSNSQTVSPGTYNVTEPAVAGYTASYSGCSNIVIANGETKTCTITNNDQTAALTLIKTVVSNYGGPAAGAWTLAATGPTSFGGTTGVTSNVNVGTYTLSESGPTGFTASAWQCTNYGTLTNGLIILSLGGSDSCTITNTAIQPRIKVIKTVVDNYNGGKTSGDFTMSVSGTDVTLSAGNTNLASSQTFPGSSTGTYVYMDVGAFNVTETELPGYTKSLSGDCSGPITLGDINKVCTITNTAIAPQLTVIKHVVNGYGVTKVASDFTMNVTGTSVSNPSFAGNEAGTTVSLKAGTYSVDESMISGYSKSLSADCSGSISVGQSKTCTITNTAVQPKLTVTKIVVDNYGGTKKVSDFPLFVGTTGVTSGIQNGFNAGTYTVRETADPGYSSIISGDCAANGSISLALADVKACTITNTAIQPKLTVTKIVNNTNGGTKTITDFPLNVSGTSVTSGVQRGFNAGTYTVAEVNNPSFGYTSVITGDCASSGSITLALGDVKTCTITNTAKSPILTLNKKVINDNGGTALESNWTLTASGPSTLTGSGATGNADVVSGAGFKAGTYTLSESGGPSGYAPTLWTCSNGVQVINSQITLNPGQVTICEITNNDIAPKLTLIKQIIGNQYGDNSTVNSFGLKIGNTAVTSGQTLTLNKGDYTINEAGKNGYEFVGITGNNKCPNVLNGKVTLALGDNITCTIANRAIAPSLTLKKIAINDNGGTILSGNFTLKLNNTQFSNGLSYTDPHNSAKTSTTYQPTVNKGTYSLSESSVMGYDASDWRCNGGQFDSRHNEITVNLGDSVLCEITNDDIAPKLTLIKKVIDNYNSNANKNDWTLAATSDSYKPTDISGISGVSSKSNFKAGTYALSEASDEWAQNQYDASTWKCVGSKFNLVDGSLAIQLGANVTCTITNTMKPATLIVQKVVVNGDNGENTAGDYSFSYTCASGHEDHDQDNSLLNRLLSYDHHNDGCNQENKYEHGNNSNIKFIQDENEYFGKNTLLVPAGSYTVTEDQESQDNYITTYQNCTDIVLTNGNTQTCTITNTKKSNVIVNKFNDINENGIRDDYLTDQQEPAIEGITVMLYETDSKMPALTGTTDANGNYIFENINPGSYYLQEQLEENGPWTQTSLYCDGQRQEDDSIDNGFNLLNPYLYASPGTNVYCHIGNAISNKVETLAKTNNATAAKRVGDVVIYTLIVTNPEDSGILYAPRVFDAPPKGFTYVTGSWTATSNLRGDLKAAGLAIEPTYASPGAWTFGGSDPTTGIFLPGEVFTLTYKTVIQNGVAPATYPDVALAISRVANPNLNSEAEFVFANRSVNSELSPFVGTQVAVITDPLPPVTTNTLVYTGQNNVYLGMFASILMIGGVILSKRVLSPRKEAK